MYVIDPSNNGADHKTLMCPPAMDLQQDFAELGVLRSFGPGTQLLEQGTPVDDIYFIHEGIVKLVWTEPRGKQTILGLRWNGSPLGVASAIVGDASPVSAVTVVRSFLRRISVRDFLDHLQRSGELGWKMHRVHCRELSEHLNSLGELACCPARSRLARIFERLIAAGQAENDGDRTRVRLPLKQRELAELIGVTPEHLSRILRELSTAGLLFVRKGWIVVPDVSVLTTI